MWGGLSNFLAVGYFDKTGFVETFVEFAPTLCNRFCRKAFGFRRTVLSKSFVEKFCRKFLIRRRDRDSPDIGIKSI